MVDMTGNGTGVSSMEQTIMLVREDHNRLRGRLFQFFESLGLPDKQEQAAKGMVRHITYDMQAKVESRLRGT